jgi:hypothetical protein
MKRHLLFLFLIICISPSVLPGQSAERQAGLRTGVRSGFFYQANRAAGNAEIGYNTLLSFSNKGLQLTGLRIVYETALTDIAPDLYLAWGYGAHVGFIYTDHIGYFGERYSFETERFCPVVGADGWLAAEYRFRDVPINISLNLKPYIELTIPSFVKIMPADIGISISYVF